MDILLVEDDNSHAELIQRSLARGQVTVLRAPTAHRALSLLNDRPFHVVVLDYSLPDRDGLDVLNDIRTRHGDLPVVFLTSADSAEICAKALKGGAVDYVVKKRNYLDVLPGVVSQACAPLEAGRSSSGDGADREDRSLIGSSAAIEQLRAAIRRAAPSTATVLIEGETGSGKEIVARAIHKASARARGPFVAVNCTEIAESLFESELFGHTRGAFTGALADRKGLLESANGGTLLLDEIEDLPPGPQVKFLRVLQSREFKPVGTSRFVRFDARVIAASNQEIERLVQQNRFRADLFFRLDVLRIRVPPLRDRREDVPELIAHAITRFNRTNRTRYGTFSADAMAVLIRRPWPGNVRELENLVERTLVNSSDSTIDESAILAGTGRIDEADERERILAALQRNQWNRERAARELGLSRVTLWRRMSRYKLY